MILEKLSALYREENANLQELYKEKENLEKTIGNKQEVTAQDYLNKLERIEHISKRIELTSSYLEGVSASRKIVMDIESE